MYYTKILNESYILPDCLQLYIFLNTQLFIPIISKCSTGNNSEKNIVYLQV